ncbi:hypothetical protein H4R33_000314 [Dimargaris cristalligena]|nr:hypothetical protein H4R33_000314 [Dimargaris cristalligena]
MHTALGTALAQPASLLLRGPHLYNPVATHPQAEIEVAPEPAPAESDPAPASPRWTAPAHLIEPREQIDQLHDGMKVYYGYYTTGLWIGLLIIIVFILASIVWFPYRVVAFCVLGAALVACLAATWYVRRKLKIMESHYTFLRTILSESHSLAGSTSQLAPIAPPPPSYRAALKEPPAYPPLIKTPSYRSTCLQPPST